MQTKPLYGNLFLFEVKLYSKSKEIYTKVYMEIKLDLKKSIKTWDFNSVTSGTPVQNMDLFENPI